MPKQYSQDLRERVIGAIEAPTGIIRLGEELMPCGVASDILVLAPTKWCTLIMIFAAPAVPVIGFTLVRSRYIERQPCGRALRPNLTRNGAK
jgi:hypothetical protein